MLGNKSKICIECGYERNRFNDITNKNNNPIEIWQLRLLDEIAHNARHTIYMLVPLIKYVKQIQGIVYDGYAEDLAEQTKKDYDDVMKNGDDL